MSQPATLPDIRTPVAALPEFEKFRTLIIAASGFVPRSTSLQMMSEVMHHPSLPYKVLYLAGRKETCFWERFGHEIRDQVPAARALARKTLAERVWKTFTIEARHNLRCLDLTDAETLRAIGADGATFAGSDAVTQAWAGALMD